MFCIAFSRPSPIEGGGTSHNYTLRPRAHYRSLPERLSHLKDCNFIIRMSLLAGLMGHYRFARWRRSTSVVVCKAPSTPATMSKQHCRMLQCRMLFRHCCRFWHQCRSNVLLCCQKRQQCRMSFALKLRPFDKVERCFDIVAQNGNIVEATGNKVACCFDNVASVDRA